MLYFAYGSNMDWNQMRSRCPSARFFCIAMLPHHQLAFTRKSKTRNCGVADVVPQQGKSVWGVVYEIADVDVGRLDFCEGYSPGRGENAYWRRECLVFKDGNPREPLTVWTYFAAKEPNPPLPSSKYKEQIIRGARFWHLPEEYIRELEQIKVSVNPGHRPAPDPKDFQRRC